MSNDFSCIRYSSSSSEESVGAREEIGVYICFFWFSVRREHARVEDR